MRARGPVSGLKSTPSMEWSERSENTSVRSEDKDQLHGSRVDRAESNISFYLLIFFTFLTGLQTHKLQCCQERWKSSLLTSQMRTSLTGVSSATFSVRL